MNGAHAHIKTLVSSGVAFNNRQYSILRSELKRFGASEGPKALDMALM